MGASALLVAALLGWVGPGAVAHSMAGADAGWLLLGLATSVAASAMSALRWLALVRWLGHPMRKRWLFAVHFKAAAVNAVLPGALLGGDLYRSWRLTTDGCPTRLAALSVLLDRASGLWGLLAVGALALLAGVASGQNLALPWGVGRWLSTPEGLAWALLVSAVVLLAPPLALIAARRWSRSRRHASLLPSTRGMWLRQAGSALLVQALYALSMACAALAFGIPLPAWVLALSSVPIFLVAALPISFGGWGTREAIAVAVWGGLGASASAAFSASLAYGAFGLGVALLGLPVWRSDVAPGDLSDAAARG